jgi:hypothetical protein
MTKEELKARLEKEKARKTPLLESKFPKLFMLVGLVMLVLGSGTALYNYNFMQNAHQTVGRVIRLDGGNYRQGYAPVVDYKDNKDNSHLFYSNEFSRPPRYTVGQQVNIYYRKNQPSDAIMGYSWIFIGVFLLLGIVFTFFGFIIQKLLVTS